MSGSSPIFASPDDLSSPPGYSHVVTIPAGRLVWTAGQIAMDADGTVVAVGDWEAQGRRVFDNLTRALEAAGADGSRAPRPSATTTGRPEGRPVKLIRRRPTLPGPRRPSTIGAEGLNCSVRNGKRCLPLAMTTEKGEKPPAPAALGHGAGRRVHAGA